MDPRGAPCYDGSMLWLAGLLLIVTFVGFTLLFKLGTSRMGALLGKATFDRHRAAEEILSSGRVPASWQRVYGPPPYGSDLQRRVHRRLERLLRYFKSAPVFDGEESRTVLMEELRAAQSRWAAGIWELPESEREPDRDSEAGSAEVEGPEPIPPSSGLC
jgi:hypothetical protein